MAADIDDPDDLEEIEELVRSVVRPAIHPVRVGFDVAAHHLHGEPVPAAEALARRFEPFEVGQPWGGRWDTTWFRLRAQVPKDALWAGPPLVALIHLGGGYLPGFSAEGLVWDRECRPVQGVHHRHREVPLDAGLIGDGTVELYVEAAANPVPPWHLRDWPYFGPDYVGEPLYTLEQAQLATKDAGVEALFLDMRVALQFARGLPERADEAVAALHEAAEVLRPAASAGGLGVAALAAAARAVLAPLFAARSSSKHAVTAVGHAHIDSAWLWPVRETRRKCARTFANQLRLMERYPEHQFACSQAVHYQWIRDGYPDLYARIRERVGEGRWQPVGGMWVEADCNVPSGESLVRQFVHGKRFFAEELGVETSEMWIPDVFGYSAALPQIAVRAGVSALVTQKMSWNDTNRFPHSTFWWEGHDGSRILAHFPPADTYNGDFSVGELAKSQVGFQDHGRSGASLYPYGYGDGGGGPTAHMLESARRLADAAGLPRVGIGSVAGFLEAVSADGAALATWSGELYLETHRATLTTHADVKLANRRCEEALREAELWSVAAGVDRRGELDGAWKLLLLQQFHDIIPGSSIGWVYEDAARDHAGVAGAAGAVTREAVGRLAGAGPGTVAFNASSYDRDEVVELPGGRLARVAVAGCAWGPVDARDTADRVEVGDGFVENGELCVRWDPAGLLTSVWDKSAGREVLAEGEKGNVFQLHEDHPRAFDAWNVDRECFETATDLVEIELIEVIEEDALRAGVRFVRRFGDSTISQTLRLSAGSRRLEFRTDVDWHEHHRFLKVAFPVAVRSSRATFEIQHGHVERPTVANTSWDEARFEVCGHRWADLSEPGYGVALINDCKYGYDVRGHVMRLSLLRGPGFPDPEADQGEHHFAYALLPHLGDLRGEGGVVEQAESFNLPMRFASSGAGSGRVVSLDRRGVSVEAVKWADRGSGVVVRLCEVWGRRGPVRVTPGFPFESVARADLLEREVSPVAGDGGTVELHLRPFELVTLRFSGTEPGSIPASM